MSSIDMTTPEALEPSIGSLDDTNPAQLQALALDAWRAAEAEVKARWDVFLAAHRPSGRRAAFAAYLAALAADAAAADALAQTNVDLAAAA